MQNPGLCSSTARSSRTNLPTTRSPRTSTMPSRRVPPASCGCETELPLLVLVTNGEVRGTLLTFSDPVALQIVERFEPKSLYSLRHLEVQVNGQLRPARGVVGRSPRQGSGDERIEEWGAHLDPVFTNGLEYVRRQTVSLFPKRSFPAIAIDDDFWSLFFGLQACHLLLWSAVQRLASMVIGGAVSGPVGVMTRIQALMTVPGFAEALEAAAPADVGRRRVHDSRDPTKKVAFDGRGGALAYWYQIRSNLTHRGKSAFLDGELLYQATVELHDTIRGFLAATPNMASAWDRLLPADDVTWWLSRDYLRERTDLAVGDGGDAAGTAAAAVDRPVQDLA